MALEDLDNNVDESLTESYEEQGYIFLQDVFKEEKIRKFRREADRILELVINSSLACNRTSQRLGIVENSEGDQSIREVHPYLDLSRVYKEVANQGVKELLEKLFDERFVSMDRAAQLNYKQPLKEPIHGLDVEEGDDQFPIHADWPYYKDRFPDSLITTIIFIDDCTENKGPIEVWSGTHRTDIDHKQTEQGLGVPAHQVSEEESEKITGSSGSILILDPRLIHNSESNRTDEPRRLAVYRHALRDDLSIEPLDGGARPGKITDYPIELVESTFENEYRRLKRQNRFQDRFSVQSR